MNAPPWPVNPSVGQMFQNWVWSGAQWIATPTTGLRVSIQTFKVSGSYMPSPGLVTCVVECVGGGGGGGGAWAPDSTYIVSGGGGGSGGYSKKMLPAALVRGGVPVTVGAGGPIQEPGQPTSFGALCLAGGGGAGQLNDTGSGSGNAGWAGPGAAPGIGDVTFPGASGHYGFITKMAAPDYASAAGALGGQLLSGAVGTAVLNGNSEAGYPPWGNTGAGGAGAIINQYGTPNVTVWGGPGASGLCIVTEYCWGDRDDVAQWSPPLNVNLNWPHPPFPPGGPWPSGLPPPGPWPRSEDDC